jgi:hypothetical protein
VCQPDFDDNAWRDLTLPHDFVVEGDVSRDADEAHGFLPYGTAWYRLRFHIPASAKGSSLWIDFDGVQKSSITYLKGKYLGMHSTGTALSVTLWRLWPSTEQKTSLRFVSTHRGPMAGGTMVVASIVTCG